MIDLAEAESKLAEVYVYEETRVAPDTNNITLVGSKLKEGEVVEIEAFYLADVDTANKTLRLGYDRGGTKFWVKRQAAGTNIYGIYLDRPLILVQNEAPAAMVESPTLNDDITVIARGRYL